MVPLMHFKFAAIAVCLTASAAAADLRVAGSHADGFYAVGEPAVWTVAGTGTVDYVVERGGRTEVARGTLDLSKPATVTATLDAPGALLLVLTPRGPHETGVAFGMSGLDKGGAVFGANRIALAVPRPADFDAFWDAQLARLARVPVNPSLTPAPSGVADVDYGTVRLDGIDGTHVQGQLARPAAPGKRPALLILQWAGVYPLEKHWVTDRAAQGWLTLNIEPHDVPVDRPPAFYQALSAGPLAGYPALGNDDRDRSYFRRMYLSCVRAVDYLAARDDWDGRTLVVTGESQGGQQTLVLAGLEPRVTAAAAVVPAGCDLNGPAVGRDGGWPKWYDDFAGKDPAAVRRAAGYFDAANFAPRIRCPVLVGAGLVDTICPPAGVIAAFNQIRSPKRLALMPFSGHQDHDGSHAPFQSRLDAWLAALAAGRPAAP